MGGADPDEDGAPADADHHRRQHGHHHQLARAHATHHDGVGGARFMRIGAGHHDANRRRGGDAVADGESDAVEHEGVPWLGHEAHGADGEPAQRHAAPQHHAQAHAVGDFPRVKHGDGGDDLKHRDGQAQFAAPPAQLLDHGPQRQPDGEPRSSPDEQHEKSGDQHKNGARLENLHGDLVKGEGSVPTAIPSSAPIFGERQPFIGSACPTMRETLGSARRARRSSSSTAS